MIIPIDPKPFKPVIKQLIDVEGDWLTRNTPEHKEEVLRRALAITPEVFDPNQITSHIRCISETLSDEERNHDH